MKTINVNMKAELTGTDLLEALVATADPKLLLASLLEVPGVLGDYVKRNRAEVTKAVTGYLAKAHSLKADKVVYQNGKVLVEAHTLGTTFTPVVVAKDRAPLKGHRKPNTGIFDYLREYFGDLKTKEIKFEEVLKDAKFFYPKLTTRLLQIYLHDRRQLKGIDYTAKRGTVIVK